MRREFAGFLLAFLFVLSGTAAAYSRCIDVNHRVDSNTEHDAHSIRCPGVALNANLQRSSAGRSHSVEPGIILTSSSGRTDRVLAVTRCNQNKFAKPFSQQDLYQLEEVFRL